MSFFEIQKNGEVGWIYLNRPAKRNFMNWDFWVELPEVVQQLENDSAVKCLVIAGHGASFSMGLDLADFGERLNFLLEENAANRSRLWDLILTMQKGFNVLENCRKPSIAAVHRHCIGGGLDLIAAADIRYCSADAQFSLREVKVGIVADMGSLQRLPHIIGEGHTRELALTGRDIDAETAFRMGLVTKVCSNKEELYIETQKLAEEIAGHDEEVLRGIKLSLDESRNRNRAEALQSVAMYNAGFLQNSSFLSLISGLAKRKK